MSGREMVPEQKPETFSPEEGQNVKIVCALSSTAYELLPNFKAILTSAQGKQHKIKLFEVFAEIAEHAPNFLLTGNRIKDLLKP
jgi:hypothetical protein